MSICFAGGGYMCIYQLGVVKYIKHNQSLFKNYDFYGASCGSAIAMIARLCIVDDTVDVDQIVCTVKNHCLNFRNNSWFNFLYRSQNKITDFVENIFTPLKI